MLEERLVDCCYLKRRAPGLRHRPMPGILGEKIYALVSEEAWQLWLKEQTKLINEKRLDPMQGEHKKLILSTLQQFLGLDAL